MSLSCSPVCVSLSLCLSVSLSLSLSDIWLINHLVLVNHFVNHLNPNNANQPLSYWLNLDIVQHDNYKTLFVKIAQCQAKAEWKCKRKNKTANQSKSFLSRWSWQEYIHYCAFVKQIVSDFSFASTEINTWCCMSIDTWGYWKLDINWHCLLSLSSYGDCLIAVWSWKQHSEILGLWVVRLIMHSLYFKKKRRRKAENWSERLLISLSFKEIF